MAPTIRLANDVPDATTNEDTAVTIGLSGSDAETCELTFSIVSGPSNGTLGSITNASCVTGTPNTDSATVTYTPNLNYNGSDSFIYRVSDGSATDDGRVTITIHAVNDKPVAVDDAYTTAGGTTLSVVAPGVLANDSDVDGDPLTAILGTGPASGSLTLAANGSFTYTPNAGYHGSDSFTYTAYDGIVASNVATVTITVGSKITIASLTGSSTSQGSSRTAIATVVIKDASNNPVNNATVSESWSNGTTGTGSCVTGEDGIAGTCTIDKSGILKRVSSVKFTVTSVKHTTLTLDETQKVVTIFKP